MKDRGIFGDPSTFARADKVDQTPKTIPHATLRFAQVGRIRLRRSSLAVDEVQPSLTALKEKTDASHPTPHHRLRRSLSSRRSLSFSDTFVKKVGLFPLRLPHAQPSPVGEGGPR